jgi:hypothetical protein
MMHQAQLDQPQQWPFPIEMPALDMSMGMLGNAAIQIPDKAANPDAIWAVSRSLTSAQPAFKLALLKGQKFTPEGRGLRIAASLAAMNAPQPTVLTLAQWKEIVEEVEDED